MSERQTEFTGNEERLFRRELTEFTKLKGNGFYQELRKGRNKGTEHLEVNRLRNFLLHDFLISLSAFVFPIS
jgi:hypothetical protein